jgi:hypothetical protein
LGEIDSTFTVEMVSMPYSRTSAPCHFHEEKVNLQWLLFGKHAKADQGSLISAETKDKQRQVKACLEG